MRTGNSLRKVLALLLGLGCASVALAEPVARVLLAKGESQLERQGQRQGLTAGALLEPGDTLLVGERAAVQVRFTDESLVALRANTVFRIDQYKYAKGAADEKLAVSLAKGGLRTVTGLIGKAHPPNFSLTTPTAVVGVRGTHFVALHCQDDCPRPEGGQESNGTYGGVTDGRIGVTNGGGDVEFGQQEYFYVQDSQVAAKRLIAPPAILNDRTTRTQDQETVRLSSGLLPEEQLGGQTSVTHLPMPLRPDGAQPGLPANPWMPSAPEWVDITGILNTPSRQFLLP